MKPLYPLIFFTILLVSCASNDTVKITNEFLKPNEAFTHSVSKNNGEIKVVIKIAENCYIFNNTIKVLGNKNQNVSSDYYKTTGNSYFYEHDRYGRITVSKDRLLITLSKELINKKHSELYIYFEGGAHNNFYYVPQKIKILL